MQRTTKRLTILILVFIAGALFLTGCGHEEYIPEDTTTQRLMSGSKVEFTHEVEGLTITTSYDTNGYDLSEWLITENKMIRFTLGITEPTGAIVLVEHAHLDMALKATDPQLNGQSQDSMDDSYHGAGQDGFHVSDDYSYSEIFSVEGFSQDIWSVWGHYCGSYGQVSGSSKRLTEANLRDSGVYGSELSVVYNLLIRHPGEDYFHTVPIADKILVPVDKNWQPAITE